MKKLNALLPVALLILTSCASHTIPPTREVASDGFNCMDLLNHFLNPKKKTESVFNVYASEDAVFNRSYEQELAKEFENIPWEKRQNLMSLFSAVSAGRMSVSAFKKIVAEFPETNTQVSMLIYKKAIAGDDAKNKIAELFSEFKLNFSFQKETNDYYILDVEMKSAADVEQFSQVTSFASFQGLVFGKNEALPSNRKFKIPDSVLTDLNDQIKDKVKKAIDVRYGILNNAQEYSNVSHDALKKITLDFDGKTPLDIVFSSPKRVLVEQRKINPNYFTGDHYKDVESGFELIENLKGKYVRLPETNEEVSFKITLSSFEDLRLIQDLFSLSVGGRISLP